jgi:hypothetical protein
VLLLGLGGTNLATNETMFKRVHSYAAAATYGVNWALPSNPIDECDINDSMWHHIILTYRLNSTWAIRNWSVYVDGNLCYNVTGGTGKQFTSAQSFFEDTLDLRIWTRGGFWVNIDNISLWEANETENFTGTSLTVYQCSDGLDNDGDGFIDYGSDDSCTSLTDDTESPYSYVQCNNGIDDDGDGYIDYPTDPSCSALTDTTESPKDATTQPDNTCLVQNRCVLLEQFPYTDNITLHGWYGDTDNLTIWTSLGDYHLLKQNSAQFYNATLNISNPNIYDTLDLDFLLFYSNRYATGSPLQSFYIKYLDAQNREVIKLRFDLQNSGVAPYLNMTINNVATYPIGNVTPIWNFVPCTTGSCTTVSTTQCGSYFCSTKTITQYPEYGYASFNLNADQTLKEYEMTFIDYNEGVQYHYGDTLPFSNTLSSKIDKIQIENINMTDDWFVLTGLWDIFGDLGEYQTTCDSYQSPHYLVESWNGFPANCNWTTYDDSVYFMGQYSLDSATPRYYAQKSFAPITDQATRYATLEWDMQVTNLTGVGSWALRLYDTDDFMFFQTYILDASTTLMYENDGTSEDAYSFSIGAINSMKLVIDSQADSFDLYVNGSKVISGGGFTDAFYNLNEYDTIKIDTSYLGINIDNLDIYASDSDGDSLLPDEAVSVVPDNSSIMCGLMLKYSSACQKDSDCESGDCLPNGQCNRFDMTYCDEHSMVRGNRCIIGAIAACAGKNTASVLLDNLLYVLVGIIILIALVYVSVMFRQRR